LTSSPRTEPVRRSVERDAAKAPAEGAAGRVPLANVNLKVHAGEAAAEARQLEDAARRKREADAQAHENDARRQSEKMQAVARQMEQARQLEKARVRARLVEAAVKDKAAAEASAKARAKAAAEAEAEAEAGPLRTSTRPTSARHLLHCLPIV